ncbi:MAG: prenyltransferase [Spirochaetaceae bacterium]|nr:MAG: prenyltransferase [Spirochaetaceae bacterium]
MTRAAIASSVKVWFLSLRPYSFTASLMPILLAAAVVFVMQRKGELSAPLWVTFPLFAVAGVLFHAGTNVLNDYYDYIHGVDSEGDVDPTHLLTRGLVTPKFMHRTGHIYFAVGVLVGVTIGIWRGPVFVGAGIVAASAAYFYTSRHLSLKYLALGDIVVFLLLGPAMVAMGTWALTGAIPMYAVAVSLPVAFLVTAIMHGNNLRDVETDKVEGILTLAGLIGRRASKHLLSFLLLAPFAVTVGLVGTGTLHPVAILSFGALIPAVRLMKKVYRAKESAALALLPLSCAFVHIVFSSLFLGALVLEGLVFTG